MEGRKQPGSEMEVPEAGLAVEKPQGTLIVEALMHVWPAKKTSVSWQAGEEVREGQQETHHFPGHLFPEASVSHQALELPFPLSRNPKSGCNQGTEIAPWTLTHLHGTGSVVARNVLGS